MTSERPVWLLDELATVGAENVDSAHVARYDDKEDAHAADEVAYLRTLGLDASSTVVELGAGTGQLALEAADVFGRVVAVDPSPVMLRRLREKAAERSSALEVVEAGFLTYEHEGRPPDLVYSRLALHHLPDAWKAVALTRVRAMLPPGGLLRLWDVVFHFSAAELPARVEAWAATLPETAPEGDWVRSDVHDHIRDEHSTFTWLLEPMLADAGFETRDATYADEGFSAQYLLTAR
jgi:SAM-dependent methyltransferase